MRRVGRVLQLRAPTLAVARFEVHLPRPSTTPQNRFTCVGGRVKPRRAAHGDSREAEGHERDGSGAEPAWQRSHGEENPDKVSESNWDGEQTESIWSDEQMCPRQVRNFELPAVLPSRWQAGEEIERPSEDLEG